MDVGDAVGEDEGLVEVLGEEVCPGICEGVGDVRRVER